MKEFKIRSIGIADMDRSDLQIGIDGDFDNQSLIFHWVEIIDEHGNALSRGGEIRHINYDEKYLVLIDAADLMRRTSIKPGHTIRLHDTASKDEPELPPEPEIPLYQSHKKVGALKIAGVRVRPNGTELSFVDTRFRSRTMPRGWGEKHRPEVGGYLVYYQDGYVSYSPAKPFEDGYTLIEGA